VSKAVKKPQGPVSGTYDLYPQGVCSNHIQVKLQDGLIAKVVFENGCDGNGKALGRLLQGMEAKKAVKLLAGVTCEDRGTSCADQFARCLGPILARKDGESRHD
jgi:uncharacterized protein (TIGR03905 family)